MATAGIHVIFYPTMKVATATIVGGRRAGPIKGHEYESDDRPWSAVLPGCASEITGFAAYVMRGDHSKLLTRPTNRADPLQMIHIGRCRALRRRAHSR
jgi:hypothetical protein